MDISPFFEPLDPGLLPLTGETHMQPRLGNLIAVHTEQGGLPDYSGAHIALIGVTDDRRAIDNEGCGKAPDAVRKYLYGLSTGLHPVKIVDLGNIRTGFAVTDTYFALSSAVAELVENNVFPVIIGGSQDHTFANYQAYQSLGQIINIVAVDPLFDLGRSEEELNARSYLSSIILHQPNYLFNYANIGFQSHFVDQDALRLMKNLFFDTYRLGIVRESLEEVEPIVRNADVISFDITAIRQSDAPGNGNATPNGFYGEEACQIARYAGMSDKLTSMGIYEINPDFDRNGQTAHLAAQMIWYFIDGFYSRMGDFPPDKKKEMVKYTVTMKDFKDEVIFYHSLKSDRWWMEVPIRSKHRERYERHHLVPCSYQDYQTACQNALPDRWWQTYQKLM